MTLAETETRLIKIERIIRTDFYFDRADIELPRTFNLERLSDDRPTLSLAWLNIPNSQSRPFSFERRRLTDLTFSQRPIGSLTPERLVEIMIFCSIYGSTGLLFWFLNTIPPSIVSQTLSETVIIERSPPVAETLRHLLESATSTTVGTLMGIGAGLDGVQINPLICIVTVPAGILLMGAVMGISKGLERGLAKAVENAILSSTEPTKPTKRTSRRPRRPRTK